MHVFNKPYSLYQVLVKEKAARVHMIPKVSGLKKLACGIARKNRSSIARQAVRNPVIRQKVLSELVKDVQKEMTTLCSKKTNSLLRQIICQLYHAFFSWDLLAAELERVSSTLYAILKGCINVRRRGQKKEQTSRHQRRKERQRPNSHPTMLW